jgi:hypothetical protein
VVVSYLNVSFDFKYVWKTGNVGIFSKSRVWQWLALSSLTVSCGKLKPVVFICLLNSASEGLFQ